MKPFEHYVQPLDKGLTYLTPELVTDDTGTLDSITLIDVDDRDRDGNPTVKTLSQPRTTYTNKPKKEIIKRAIILQVDEKKYVIVQGTEITTKYV